MMFGRNNNDEMAPIVVPVPPQRLRWLASEMDASGIPYRIQQDQAGQYNVQTVQMATPILQQVLGMTERWDLFDRKPEHRSNATDAMGFFVALAAVGTIIVQSGLVAEWAAGTGINGDVARGVAILVAGVTITLVWSEMFLHHDKRRHMFRESMITLFLVAAMWFILSGLGMDLAGEAQRWMP